MMKIINLTPHEIKIVKEDELLEIEPSGKVARCKQDNILIDNIEGIDIYKTVIGALEDLPEEKEDTVYITSAIVAQAVKDFRDDVLIPVDFVRNDKGVIIGCRGLAKL